MIFFLILIFFFSNSNFTLYDLRLLRSDKSAFFINFIVTLFTIYEFNKELRLFKII